MAVSGPLGPVTCRRSMVVSGPLGPVKWRLPMVASALPSGPDGGLMMLVRVPGGTAHSEPIPLIDGVAPGLSRYTTRADAGEGRNRRDRRSMHGFSVDRDRAGGSLHAETVPRLLFFRGLSARSPGRRSVAVRGAEQSTGRRLALRDPWEGWLLLEAVLAGEGIDPESHEVRGCPRVGLSDGPGFPGGSLDGTETSLR